MFTSSVIFTFGTPRLCWFFTVYLLPPYVSNLKCCFQYWGSEHGTFPKLEVNKQCGIKGYENERWAFIKIV